MENATKALLIAGSVLIAIVLIAVGLKILNSTSGVTKQVDDLSTTMEKSMFNSQYTKYEGQRKGTEVKSLLNLIYQNNKNSNNKIKVAITDGDGGISATPGTDQYESNWAQIYNIVKVNATYDIEISLSDTGYVNYICINE